MSAQPASKRAKAKAKLAKRPSRSDQQAEQAERLARMLAEAPADGSSPVAPPAFITDPRLKPAAAVWRQLAPRLHERDLLGDFDRGMFAMLCYYTAEWIAAVDDILERGYSIMVRTVSKDMMPRRNPSVDRRDIAFDVMSDLSRKFGLTPLDRHVLHKAKERSDYTDLFDGQGKPGAADDAEKPAEAEPTDSWGHLLDRDPQGQRPN